jgi:hypothetical protein
MKSFLKKGVKASAPHKQLSVPEPLLGDLEVGLWAQFSKLALLPEWLRSIRKRLTSYQHAVLSRKSKTRRK